MKLNIHIYSGETKNSSRILKEIEAISKLNHEIDIVVTSTSRKGPEFNDDLGEGRKIKIFSLYFMRFEKSILVDLLKYMEFAVRVFVEYRCKKINYLNIHSLNVLVVGVALKLLGDVECLIYDPHELETERVGLRGAPKIISKYIEKFLIKFVDQVIVVSEPIAMWYKKTYRLNEVAIVRNIPQKNIEYSSNILREKLKINEADLVFIYQGVLSKARGVFEVMDAFKISMPDRHVVFMGYGPDVDVIMDCTKIFNNIHYLPAVSTKEIIKYTSGADVGLNFIVGDLCLSYRYSLPNKFYEYLYAGCCVLVSENLEYLSEIILSKNLGWSIKPSVNSLCLLINSLNRDEIKSKRSNILNYIDENSWEKDAIAYELIYK